MKINFFYLIILSISYVYCSNYNAYVEQKKLKEIQLKKLHNQGFLLDKLKFILRNFYNKDNPYKNIECSVRRSSDLCSEENNIISQRLKLIKTNIENFLNINLDDNDCPRLAICASGGGYRAMIATLGFLTGIYEIGLLDSILYMSSLSGSTWALSTWMCMETNLYKLKDQLSNNIASNPKIGKFGIIPPIKEYDQIKTLINNKITEYLFNQPLEIIDIYGALLANNLFAPLSNRQNLKLTNQIESINNGNHIFPIYTAIEPTDENFHYDWYEFTPFEAGNIATNCYIPTWAFSREFNNGKSVEFSTISSKQFGPELSLAYLMGIFGSAFEIDIKELSSTFAQNLNFVQKCIFKALLKYLLPIENMRLLPSKTYNFMYNLENCKNKNEKLLILIDAGIDFNLPFPPLLRPQRKVDIILVCDASADVNSGLELQKAENYAKQNNIKFPKIDYENINKESVNIFFDEDDANTPTIIYCPFIKDINLPNINDNPMFANFDTNECINNGFCNTFNCQYTKEQFDLVFSLAKLNIIENKDKIKNAILKKINLRKS